MFNLFPEKKSVDEVIEDSGLYNKEWEWTPTQTPSMLQAQNELIEQFLKENYDLKIENQELKNDWHQPELCNEKIAELLNVKKALTYERDTAREINCKQLLQIEKWDKVWDEQNKNIIELTKEVINLRHLKQENVDLIEMLAKYRDGYQGCCYACEPVGELNQKLELRLTAYQKMVEGASEAIDNLKKELYEVRMENNSLKVFPIEDKDDVRLQKHPMYPIHWGSLDPDIYEKAKGITIEEAIDSVKKEVSWEQAASDLALRVTKLEEQLKYTQKIVYKDDPNYEYFKKHGKWPYDGEESNPLYKNY